MILKLFLGDNEHSFSWPFFNKMPVIQQEFEPFGLMLSCDTCSVVFNYNELDADPTGDEWALWCNFLKLYQEDITRIKIISNNGVEFFSGVIDTEADINCSIQDSTIAFEFISDISSKLNQEHSEETSIASWLLVDDIGSSNPGACILKDMLENYFNTNLPEFTLNLPSEFDDLTTALDHVYLAIKANFPEVTSYRLQIDTSSSSFADILKSLCNLGYFRLIFSGDQVTLFSYASDQSEVEPDGTLFNTNKGSVLSNVIESLDLSSSMTFTLYNKINNYMILSAEENEEFAQTHIEEFYSSLTAAKCRTRDYEGLNKNINAGDNIIINNEKSIITDLERDLAFIDEDYQRVSIKGVEII